MYDAARLENVRRSKVAEAIRQNIIKRQDVIRKSLGVIISEAN